MSTPKAMDSPQGQSVLSKSELDSRFQAILKENNHLRKVLQAKINEANRLRSLLLELISHVRFRKVLSPSSDKDRSQQFYIQLLNEKIDVLTQQLLGHSRFHGQVHKCYRRKKMPENRAAKISSLIYKCGENTLKSLMKNCEDKEGEELALTKSNGQVENKISGSFQKQCGDEMDKVLNNLDIIRLKRLIKRQAIQNALLSYHLEASNNEADQLRKALKELQEEFETLAKEIDEEKKKKESLQSMIIEVNSLRHLNKMLKEEIRDVQEEKNMLKLTNQKLLDEVELLKSSDVQS